MCALRSDGPLRFSQLRARIEGVSEKMLSQTLRELEHDGLLTRTSFPVVPPHVEYALTPMGSGVAASIREMIDYIERHVGEVITARQAHDSPAAPAATEAAAQPSGRARRSTRVTTSHPTGA